MNPTLALKRPPNRSLTKLSVIWRTYYGIARRCHHVSSSAAVRVTLVPWLAEGLCYEELRNCHAGKFVWTLVFGLDGSTIDRAHKEDLHQTFHRIEILPRELGASTRAGHSRVLQFADRNRPDHHNTPWSI